MRQDDSTAIAGTRSVKHRPSGQGTPRPTMKDVARLAGVGIGTVSRVVNGKSNVSGESITAVNAAITQLGFRRNDGARVLRTGATASIGLLVEDVADPFFSVLNRAVEEEVFHRGSVLLTGSSNKDAHRAKELILTFCARRVDGLIVTLPEGGDEDYLQQEQEAGISVVFIDRPPQQLEADVVLVDNRGGSEMAVRHLLSNGHRRIACFTDQADLYTARERLAGYGDALGSADITVDSILVHASQTLLEDLAEPLAAMMALPEPPTAVFAANNRISVALIRAMRGQGAKLGLVGFDDFELADFLQPAVTVVAQDPEAMGRAAMELLSARIAGYDGPARTVVLDTVLIERDSGGLPAEKD